MQPDLNVALLVYTPGLPTAGTVYKSVVSSCPVCFALFFSFLAVHVNCEPVPYVSGKVQFMPFGAIMGASSCNQRQSSAKHVVSNSGSCRHVAFLSFLVGSFTDRLNPSPLFFALLLFCWKQNSFQSVVPTYKLTSSPDLVELPCLSYFVHFLYCLRVTCHTAPCQLIHHSASCGYDLFHTVCPSTCHSIM